VIVAVLGQASSDRGAFNRVTDVTHPFFKINELRFSEFATAIDSSERLRNIRE
jgi:hypothetical protein